MAAIKPDLGAEDVRQTLAGFWGRDAAADIRQLSGGNLSAVYAFELDGEGYVIRFSRLPDAFRTERDIAGMLNAQGVPYPRFFGLGGAHGLTYAVSERMEGRLLADIPEAERRSLAPGLTELMARMSRTDVSASRGFGWIRPGGNGAYPSWEAYVDEFYGEDQTGTFWENWHDLFRTSCLERDVFEECRARLKAYAPYNAPHRHFVHNDCHAWNILTDGARLTGIIDGNCVYGDFMIDVVIAEGAIPGSDFVRLFREYVERSGKPIEHFGERALGARYYKGLDGLRFYAKMGWKPNYEQLRDHLLGLA